VLGIRISTVEKVIKAYGIDLAAFFAKRMPSYASSGGAAASSQKERSDLNGWGTGVIPFNPAY